MTQLLGRTPDEWRRIGGLDTAEEIAQQPAVWRELAHTLHAAMPALQAFVHEVLGQPGARLILTGAGSSAYVGEIAADEIAAGCPAQVRAIASTSLLTHPVLYLDADAPTLLVSFARSGNSPESLAAVELLRQRVRQVRFLNITCNAQGRLARDNAGRADSVNLLMPAPSCDRGFAMTSSFSCMLLAALTVLGRGDTAQRLAQLEQLANAAATQLPCSVALPQALAQEGFERVVYLGSGPLLSLAKEAALKVLELSSGRALALADTPLGFRHGPKSVLNAQTLVVVFRSQEAVARRYEQDLLEELQRDQVAGRIVDLDAQMEPAAHVLALPDAWLAPLWLLTAQQFALHRSAALGLTPDNPFPDGTVNRVVQGVTIHPHDKD